MIFGTNVVVFLLLAAAYTVNIVNVHAFGDDNLKERSILGDHHTNAHQAVPAEASRTYGGSNNYRYLITSIKQLPQSVYSNQAPAATPTITTSAPTSTAPTITTTVPPPVLLGSPCTGNSGCATIKGARCLNGFCDCASPTTTALSNIACIPLANAFGDKCVITAQCSSLDPLAACYLDRCMCESIYHVAGQGCARAGGGDYFLPGSNAGGGSSLQCLRKQKLNATCCDDRQCSYEVWHSQCNAGLCQCSPGFINIGTHACAPKAANLGDACSVNAQCMNINGSYCDAAGRCSCNLQAQFVAGMVLPMTMAGGAIDRRKRQAMMMSVMCMPTMRLGQMCMSNLQCSAATFSAICVGGICTCMTGFVADRSNLTCQPKALLLQKTAYVFRAGCCGNLTQSRLLGQVCPDRAGTNIGPPYTFTSGDARFMLDANGAITTTTQLTAPATFPVVVGFGTRLATATVTDIPDPCCLQTPAFTTSMITVLLLRSGPTTGPNAPLVQPPVVGTPGCQAQGPLLGGNTNTFLANVLDFLNMPCGESPTVSAASVAIVSTIMGMPTATPLCIYRANGNVEFYTPMQTGPFPFGVPTGMSAVSTVTVTATGCNGVAATSTLNIVLMCPPG